MVSATDFACNLRPLSIVFRVDSGSLLGTGHLARCLVIGVVLAERGASITYLCRDDPGNANAVIRARGFTVSPITTSTQTRKSSDCCGGNPFCESADATATIATLPNKTDLLIVDHYSCGQSWEAAMRPHCQRQAVIDDLARHHACDVLVDPNWHGLKTETRYAGRVSPLTQSLLGPDFALLDPAFAKSRVSPTNRQGKVKRVLVYFGGSDQYGLTPLALTVLAKPEFARLEVDVVIGATNKASPLGNAAAINRPGVTVYEHQDSLAKLLAGVDVAIGAVGGTTWERMCLGVPSLTVVIADNQLETANDLAAAGLIDLLGHATNVTEETLAQGLRELLNAPERRQRMADAGQAVVDGRGAERVVDVLCGLLA